MEVRRGDVGPGEHEALQSREREQNAEGGEAAHTGVGLEEVTQVPHLGRDKPVAGGGRVAGTIAIDLIMAARKASRSATSESRCCVTVRASAAAL